MAVIRTQVDPPSVNTPWHGLLDVAEVVDNDLPHWRTGVEYDTYHCHESKIWGPWCTGVGSPSVEPIVRTISVVLTGSGVEGGPYSVGFSATVDGGPPRMVRAGLHDSGIDYQAYAVTGSGEEVIADGMSDPVEGRVRISDVLTGASVLVEVEQNEDGSLVMPDNPVLLAVSEAAVPDDCDSISVEFSSSVNGDDPSLIDVSVTATTDAVVARELAVYVGSHRAVVTTGAGPQPVAVGVFDGLHRIAVRDVASWSYVAGYMYVADDASGVATLVLSTCPVKDINSPPWLTLDADPFTVFGEVSCRSLGFPDPSAAVREAFEASQSKALERQYWESLIARSLVLTGSGTVSVTRGLAELEQYLASVYTGMGVIHVSPWGAAYLSNNDLLDLSSGSLRTWRGTPVVIGHGYIREGSDVPASGDEFWMFGTGFIRIHRSDVFVASTLDQATNVLSAVAERTFVVLDDCPVPGGVRVSQAVT